MFDKSFKLSLVMEVNNQQPPMANSRLSSPFHLQWLEISMVTFSKIVIAQSALILTPHLLIMTHGDLCNVLWLCCQYAGLRPVLEVPGWLTITLIGLLFVFKVPTGQNILLLNFTPSLTSWLWSDFCFLTFHFHQHSTTGMNLTLPGL